MATTSLHRRRRLLFLLCGGGCAAYAAYRVYCHPVLVKARSKAVRYLDALSSLADAACSTADAVSLVTTDLGSFLRSRSDELPTSLRQISKLARSEELAAPLARVSEAVAAGVLRGAQSTWGLEPDPKASSTSSLDRALDKVFSDAGARFASTVAESFAKGLALGFYSPDGDPTSSSQSPGEGSDLDLDLDADAPLPWWVVLVTGDRFRRVIEGCVQTFVSTAVTVYLDKTMDVNTYEHFFAGLTNPKHEAQVKDMMAALCNGCVETVIRTTHQVMTSSAANPRPRGRGRETPGAPQVPVLAVNGKSPSPKLLYNGGGSSWIDSVSSTLAIPSNRRFVLDVTGRITFETVRSFLDYVGGNLYANGKKGAIAVRSELVERGREVVKCTGARSIVILTLCFCLFLHLLHSTRGLIPV